MRIHIIRYLEINDQAGVFACGNNSGMMRSVANAVYSGNVAGAMVNAELAKEHFLKKGETARKKSDPVKTLSLIPEAWCNELLFSGKGQGLVKVVVV